jgi:hypothetical protein
VSSFCSTGTISRVDLSACRLSIRKKTGVWWTVWDCIFKFTSLSSQIRKDDFFDMEAAVAERAHDFF